MEAPFDVAIDIDIEYEVGSPATENFDPYVIAQPNIVHHESSWQSREGPDEGDIAASTTALYPNFTSALRRHIFCVASYGTAGTIAVTWNGVAFPVGRLWLHTDPSFTAAGQAITSAGEGTWFACEGELMDDLDVMRPGSTQSFSL